MNRDEFLKKYSNDTYIGNDLYVSFNGIDVIFSIEEFHAVITLDPYVFDELIKFGKKFSAELKKLENGLLKNE